MQQQNIMETKLARITEISKERPKEVQEEKEIYGKPGKIYFMNHKMTDFRTYKPMRKSVF